jgi:DNA-binding transcriptional LysR family regulator
MVDTELLRSFVTFAETLNFTHAARRAGLSQPAFFERIQRLEAALDLSLYEKNGRVLALTAAGTQVLAFARDTDARFADFLAELRHETPRRPVTLAAGEGAYLYLLGPAIAAFARKSSAELELLTVGGRGVVEALRRGDADLAVAAIDLVPASITAQDLVETPLCVALPDAHPLSKRRSLRMAHLGEERFILTPEGQLHRDLVSRALAQRGRAPRRVLVADGWPLMLAFVQMGLGVAIVNGICALPRGVVVRPLEELGSVTYRLLRRKNAALSPDAEALAAQIRASFAPGASG